MSLRDLAVTAVIFWLLPFCLARSWIGILTWSWLGYMNPHRLTWGFAYSMPFGMMVMGTTLLGLPFNRDVKAPPRSIEVFLLLALWGWFLVTTIFAYYPGPAWEQFSKVSKILFGIFLSLMLLQEERKLKALIWVIALSIGFFGFKGGIWAFMTGGRNQVLGPPDSFISGNTEIGLALNMSVLRGFADDLPLQEWLEKKMWPMEGQFTADTVKWGTSLAIIEMLKSGTTCFLDMYDHMDTVAQVVEESGIRAVLARGVIGLCSEEEQDRKLIEATQFALDWNHQANGRITTMMSPHAPYTCSPAYIKRIVDKAIEHNLPLHIHMSETAREVQQNVQDYGQRPVAHLRDIGVFERPTLVAHAVHLEEEEMDILHQYNVKISHNPASNLKLGSGVAAVPKLLARGFRVSIGTDSAASNNNLDMFQEVRLAALIHKGVNQDSTAVPASTALQMGTSWGADAVFLDKIGTLEAGYQADFIIINPNQPHLQPALHPISHIIYSASGHDVEDVYVQGKAVVKNKECLFLDQEKIMYEANRVFKELKQDR